MKKLSTLLTQRQALLRQARLANLAFAYTTLMEFAHRIARAQLSGRVTLKHSPRSTAISPSSKNTSRMKTSWIWLTCWRS